MTDIPVVDYYSQCEDGLMALMRTLTVFFPNPWQVTRNVLDRNKGGDFFLVFRPGGFPIQQMPFSSRNALIREYNWSIMTDLYVRYKNYEEAWKAYKEIRATLIFIIGTRPFLSGVVKNVVDAVMSSDADPVYWQQTRNQASPNFILQPLRFVVRQRVTFPLAVSTIAVP